MTLKSKETKQSKKVKFIIRESFNGQMNIEEVMANIFISEFQKSPQKLYTYDKESDIITETDNSPTLHCSDRISAFGSGAGKVAQKVGGKIAVKNLAKKTPSQIKRTINTKIKVSGKDTDKVKDLSWTLKQNAYKGLLPNALVGKSIPQAFNSVLAGCSGYSYSLVAYIYGT